MSERPHCRCKVLASCAEPETKAKPAKLNNRERTSAGRAAPAAPSTHAHPEWSIAAIKALRDALSQEDLALLQSMRSSRAQLDLDVSVDGFVRQKMKEYGIAGVYHYSFWQQLKLDVMLVPIMHSMFLPTDP